MSGLPVISGKRLVKVLGLRGFEVVRIEGSHHVMRDSAGRRTVVPVHGNEDVWRPLLREILRQADISVADYLLLLKRV
jgi:predicted RNA binding protein YcfA (HicA-like mRNA interferase family)